MTANHLRKALRHLHEVLAPPGAKGPTDGQLLARFIATRDEEAFAALVRRYGQMVFGVCRRVLHHDQDAEDAFQAAFLVLARKAASVRNVQALGSWLYRVTYRIALEAKAINARRRSREKQVEAMTHPEVIPDEPRDWRSRLDHELNLLPETYRAVIVACDLEGRSRKEAARLLGLSEGTVSSRLARGRRLLAKRLSRYGLPLPAAAVATALSGATASAVPAPLVPVTVKVAVLVAAGEISAVSTSVEVLMKGAFQTMLLSKLKLAVGAVMVVMALGASGLVYRASGQSTAGPKRPLSELEALRRENELLKLNLEVVLEKVRAQEAELRAFRSAAADAKKAGVGDTLQVIPLPEGAIKDVLKLRTDGKPPEAEPMPPTNAAPKRVTAELHIELKGKPEKPDPLHEAEAALKALREARDTEAQRKAADALEKALQKLREQQKKQEGSAK
jgi:RNA polymerase sigma factor (sigma-70 family)